jgi:hypothetical protein
MSEEWLRVPVGPESEEWTTRAGRRTVLMVVHNVTSLTRLLDVASLLDGDLRLQVVFTWTRSSPFTHDVERFLADLGAIVVPWDQARTLDADLAVAASYGGELEELSVPLMVVSHGMGYNKHLNRKSKIENRGAGRGDAVFGLSADWLLHRGRPFAARVVLSHVEQLERLRRDCPEAVPTAVVAGDPCFDRLLASLPHRRRYRRAFGLGEGHTMIVVSSTWGRASLLGRRGEVLRSLLAELPLDEYRVAAILHPNIWHGHGPWQVRSWLSDCLRSGLVLLPPREGWRAALVAADLVIGDHGSVTFYGAALDRPTLLGTFPSEAVAPDSPVARLGRAAPRLDGGLPLRPQIDAAIADHTPRRLGAVTDQTTSVPGRSAELLRAELYGLMNLGEPDLRPVVARVPEPDDIAVAEVTAALVTASWEGGDVQVVRYPAAVALDGDRAFRGAHLAVDEREPEERLLELADVLFCSADRLDRVAEDWLTETLGRYPGCHLAAAEHLPGESLVALRDGTAVRVTGGPAAFHGSLVYAWTGGGRRLSDLPADCTVRVGSTTYAVSVKPAR